MMILLVLTAISVDDRAIQEFVSAVEKRRPEMITELEAVIKWERSRFKLSRDPKKAKDNIDSLVKDLEALKRFDKRCLGLAAPELQLQLHRYADIGPWAGKRDKLRIPHVGEILRVEQIPSKATIEGHAIGVRSPHGAVVLSEATELQVDLAEHDSFYLPPIVQIVKIESLKTQAGDSAIIVKEFADLNALEAAWSIRHPPQNGKR